MAKSGAGHAGYAQTRPGSFADKTQTTPVTPRTGGPFSQAGHAGFAMARVGNFGGKTQTTPVADVTPFRFVRRKGHRAMKRRLN
jgi:hypothetical protein